jgi:nicotinamidase-related amidase
MKAFAGLLVLAALRPADSKTALLVIDTQDCFLQKECTSTKADGSLSVPACGIIPKINALRQNKSCLFDEVIFTQDFHPANHMSFGSSHGLAPFAHLGGKGELQLTCLTPTSGNTKDASCCPTTYVNASAVDCDTQLCPPADFDYAVNNSDLISGNAACSTCKTSPELCYQTDQAMWTDHCVQTGDSGFPPILDKRTGDLVVQKGMNQYVDAYSAFMDNTQNLKTELDMKLQEKGIKKIFVVGIATDVCVKWTVRDALHSSTGSYEVAVVTDATAAVLGDATNYAAANAFMQSAGATLQTAEQVLAMACPVVEETSGSESKGTLSGVLLALASLAYW